MTGVNEPGRKGVEAGSEAEEAFDPHPPGAEGAEPASDYEEDDGNDEVAEGEVVGDEVTREMIDGAPAEAEGTVFDGDPLVAALDQRDEYLESLRRLQAEFENYKKRVTKQQADQVARAAVALVEKILPVLDTLDLATDHIGDAESPDGRALLAVSSQLRDVLAKAGLERIDPVGEEFDPNAHEAVGHLPAEELSAAEGNGSDPTPSGNAATSGEPVVGQVMRAGYRWRGAVVRPAMVMVRG